MKAARYCTRIIEYSFYALFFLVPLAFAGNTSELFEFNKMWLAFGITIVITAAWAIKMTMEKRIFIQRTPIDIPVLLFLASQIISTVFTLDFHISLWGYYSRFNGGLLSTIAYTILYYAFVSNFPVVAKSTNNQDKHKNHLSRFSHLPREALAKWGTVRDFREIPGHTVVKRCLTVSLFSGLIVALWGLPSHFGADPTCFVFRGSLNTDCWTDAFKPTVRVFSTLGQPAWLAAYLAVLLPVAIAYVLNNAATFKQIVAKNLPKQQYKSNGFSALIFLLFAILFYLNLIFTDTRAGFVAFWIADIFFWGFLLIKRVFVMKSFIRWVLIFHLLFFIFNFFFGVPIDKLYQYTLPGLKSHFAAHAQTKSDLSQAPSAPSPNTTQAPQQNQIITDSGITDSGKIRLYVWKGAIDAWKANPLFGTGVETFAFAYYKFRPAEHNMTSEWDYLYNKAHNEYLNYLTTTGAFGLGSYLAIIIIFLWLSLTRLLGRTWKLTKSPVHPEMANQQSNFKQQYLPLAASENQKTYVLVVALLSGYISILISNFFGFSVVIINLYLFLIPVFIFIMTDMLNPALAITLHAPQPGGLSQAPQRLNPYQWTIVTVVLCIALFFLYGLGQYWVADVAYALGTNLDHVNAYQQAYPQLVQAVTLEPGEPVYQDEYSTNLATLATALYMQKDTVNAQQFEKNAVTISNNLITNHPNNLLFWKDRVKIFYTLAEGDTANQGAFLQAALQAMIKANELAPTDAKISYNLGVLYGQNGLLDKGIEVLRNTILLKPDYRDAYFALGLFYHQKALDKNSKVVDQTMQQKAIDTYQFILDHLSPNDDQVKKSLSEWQNS